MNKFNFSFYAVLFSKFFYTVHISLLITKYKKYNLNKKYCVDNSLKYHGSVHLLPTDVCRIPIYFFTAQFSISAHII